MMAPPKPVLNNVEGRPTRPPDTSAGGLRSAGASGVRARPPEASGVRAGAVPLHSPWAQPLSTQYYFARWALIRATAEANDVTFSDWPSSAGMHS